MKLQISTNLSASQSLQFLALNISQALAGIATAINGKLTFSDNFLANVVSVPFGSANTTVPTSHGLGFVPNGYIPIGLSANMVVFNGNKPNTAQFIYLQASAIGTATLLVF